MPNSYQFIQATEAVKNLKNKPDNDTLGQLYGLFKLATLGDNKAEVQYITLVNVLLQKEN